MTNRKLQPANTNKTLSPQPMPSSSLSSWWMILLSLFLSSGSMKRRSPLFATASSAPKRKKGSFAALVHPKVPPHTLLLGTQPSDNSLKHEGYYMTNSNAFWYIVGDALGFQRGFFINRDDPVDYVRPHLLHKKKATYQEAAEALCSRGYAAWDIVAASERKGSLDSAIRDAEYADVRGFLKTYPTIRKICFSTGSQSARRFKSAHRQWLMEEEEKFRCHDDESSREVFPTLRRRTGECEEDIIELCVMTSVSPAANPRQTWSAEKQKAKGFDDEWTKRPAALYPWKRARWFEQCFRDEPHVRRAAKFGTQDSDFRSSL